jgi:hypothetical protein
MRTSVIDSALTADDVEDVMPVCALSVAPLARETRLRSRLCTLAESRHDNVEPHVCFNKITEQL